LSEIHSHKCPGSKATQSKYRVSAKAKRTDADGIVYDSALEMRRAVELKCMKMTGEITDYIHHVVVRLGDIKYETDFLVFKPWLPDGANMNNCHVVHFEDTKGAETPSFRRVRKLWPKYQKLPLVVLKRAKGGGWEREVLHGK
jgi:hypothetical protein